MTRLPCSMMLLAGATLALGLGACSDDAPPSPNPATLWLALDGAETQVRLIPVQPPIF